VRRTLSSIALAALSLPSTATANTGLELIAVADATDFQRALQCMTLAIAYEAGREPTSGQQAVAEVILNRARHPAYPKSVCGVVFQGSARRTGCQFTFTCDGAMRRTLSDQVLQSSRSVAQSVLAGKFTPNVGGATHYHANYVSPYWAPSLIKVGTIGAHIFYRAPGSVDQSARYNGGVEPIITALGVWAKAPDALTNRAAIGTSISVPPLAATGPKSAFAPWGIGVR
jgi:Cell Wall Hydrolase